MNRISASISGASAGVGRRAERQRVKVGLIGRASVKARMRPMAVVEVDVAAERSSRLVDAVIGPQIHSYFDTAPEASPDCDQHGRQGGSWRDIVFLEQPPLETVHYQGR